MPEELMQAHIENLRDRVAALESVLHTVATKDDVQGVADSVEGLVALMNHSAGLYKFILGLGAFFAAIGGIAFGIRESIGRWFQ